MLFNRYTRPRPQHARASSMFNHEPLLFFSTIEKMSFRSTSSAGSTGSPLVTAQDRCPQLEAGKESLTALRLDVSSLDKAEETLAALRGSQYLKELSVSSGCGDEEVARLVGEALLANCSLHRLTLDLRECSDQGATHLAELIEKTPSVKYLTLMLNNVTEVGAEVLAAALPNSPLLSFTLYATQMDLHDCCVGDKGAQHFARTLGHCRNLTAFTIAQSGVTDVGLEYLLQALEQNTRITSLNLHSNFINYTGAASISRFLSTGSRLKQLILNENHCIGDEGARELALALCHNSTLEVLSLKSCGVGQAGAERFATPLSSQNTSLKVLNLCGNVDIGDNAVEMIARGLKSNSSLQQLDLSSCGVTDEGCDHLADALSSNMSLTHLILHRNTVSNGGAGSLAQALTKNSSLTTLVLSGNQVGEKGAALLGQALEHNTTLIMLVLGSGGAERGGGRSPRVRAVHRKPTAAAGTSRGHTQGAERSGGSGKDRESLRPPSTETRKGEREIPTTAVAGRVKGREGQPQKKAVQQHVRLGGGEGSTLALVEVLVSKNRRLAAYKKRIRELKQQVKALEEERDAHHKPETPAPTTHQQ